MGDGAEVFDKLSPCQTDAVIGDGQGASIFIRGDADLKGEISTENIILRELCEAHFFQRIRGIGDQFPDEDFTVGVEAMDNDVQDLFYLGLEVMGSRSAHS